MKFTYTYRSSDGQRHTAEIEAESRDAAFARVRTELGIKPIKMVAEGESGAGRAASVSAAPRGGVWRRPALVAAVVLFVAVLGGGAWWLQRPKRESPTVNGESQNVESDQPITIATPQGPVTLHMATPLPRQMIPGDRKRIAEAASTFKYPAEAWLARYAEPGRQLPATIETPPAALAASHATRPPPTDFEVALREPIRLASTDFTEVVDLKRIVSGMKREMRAYLAGGGTVDGYLAELEKRQKLEVSYRERAEQKLNDMLNGQDARSPSATGGTPVVPASGQDARGRDSLKAAYAYWLKANAQLQAMGIYPLALPDALRSYQMSLDIDE